MRQRVSQVAIGVILVTALVLVIEASYVMLAGWTFSESIIGGRIHTATVVLLIFLLALTTALLHKFADRQIAFRIAFWSCVIVFAVIACLISVDFSL